MYLRQTPDMPVALLVASSNYDQLRLGRRATGAIYFYNSRYAGHKLQISYLVQNPR